MNAKEFKAKLFALDDFPYSWRNEVERSNLSFMNISFGIIPNGMSQEVFLGILRLGEFLCINHIIVPLLPPIQYSWKGSQVFDWLISAKIVDESRRSIISENLDGSCFLQGLVDGILTKEEYGRADARVQVKFFLVSHIAWKLSRPSCKLCAVTRRFFNMDFEKISSEEELKAVLIRKFRPTSPASNWPPLKMVRVEAALIRKILARIVFCISIAIGGYLWLDFTVLLLALRAVFMY
jgi:hypothetical protein